MRHRRMLAPINSVKHYVQIENTTIASGAQRATAIVDAAVAPATTNTSTVKEGAIVKAVFLEHWVKSNASAGTDTKFQYCLEKAPGPEVGITFVEMNNLQAYENKKNILYYSQGVIGDLTTQAIPIVRQWFKIPKGKQRFGLGDTLISTLTTTAAEVNNCGFATYKEYI